MDHRPTGYREVALEMRTAPSRRPEGALPTCWRSTMPPGSSGAAFLEGRRGLADALAEEVQLGAADLAVADDLDVVDARAVQLERPLHPDAAGDPPDGDGRSDAAVPRIRITSALEDLDALAVALDDLRGDLDGVAAA